MNKKLTFEMDLGASGPPSSTYYDKPAGTKVHALKREIVKEAKSGGMVVRVLPNTPPI